MKKAVLFIALFIVSVAASAQILFTAQADKYKLGVGETFTVSFKINSNGGDFNFPNFQGFTIIGGPSVSFSNFNINGVASTEKAASFTLMAIKEGEFAIGPASIRVDGKTYSTKPLTILVVEQKGNKAGSLEEKAAEMASVKILTNKRKVYVGEPIAVRYTLVLKANVGSFDYIAVPEFEGFIKNDIELKQLTAVQEELNGETMTTVDVAKFVLIPQYAGTFTPGSLQLRLPTEIPTGRRDWFGRPETQLVNQISTSTFPKIEVLPLPSANKPADFSGGVGSFKLDVNLSRNQVKGNESITLTVEVSGRGNIQLVEVPTPEIPNSIESYDPKFKEQIDVFPSGVKGSKRNEYLLIPRYTGVYKIPAMHFSFFDSEREMYVTLNSKELEITVTEGQDAANIPGGNNASVADKNEVSALSQDILFIHTKASDFEKIGTPFYPSFWHWLLVGFFIASTFLLFVFQRLRQNYNPNLAEKARKGAGSLAKKQLKAAHQKLQQNEIKAFYGELTLALQNYFQNKNNLAPANFNQEAVAEIISKKGGSEGLLADVKHLINQANMARFAPLTVANMKSDYELALKSLENLEDLR